MAAPFSYLVFLSLRYALRRLRFLHHINAAKLLADQQIVIAVADLLLVKLLMLAKPRLKARSHIVVPRGRHSGRLIVDERVPRVSKPSGRNRFAGRGSRLRISHGRRSLRLTTAPLLDRSGGQRILDGVVNDAAQVVKVQVRVGFALRAHFSLSVHIPRSFGDS